MTRSSLRTLLLLIPVALLPLKMAPVPRGGWAHVRNPVPAPTRTLGPLERRDQAHADSLLASIEDLIRRERFVEARALAESRVAHISSRSAVDDSTLAAAWSKVGEIRFLLGDAGAASDADSLALRLRIKRFGRRHLDVAESLTQLGRDQKALQGDRSGASAMQEEALEIRTDLLGPNNLDVASTLSDLANLHRLHGRHETALRLLSRALRIRREACGPISEEVASTLTAMAFNYSRRELWPQAERLFRDAVEIRRRLPTPPRQNLAISLGGLGMSLRRLHRPAEAIPLLKEVLALRGEFRDELPAGSGRATFHLSTSLDLAAAQIETGDSLGAWQTSGIGAGRILTETIAAREGLNVDSLAATPMDRIQSLLPPGTAMIGWVDFYGWAQSGYPYWAWVLKSEGAPQWVRFDAPRSTSVAYSWAGLDTALTQLRTAGAWPFRVEETTFLNGLLRRVEGLSFAPLEPHLAGIERLIVVSGDIHHGVPLEALIDAEGRFLGDRFRFSYVPSASIYAWLESHPRPARAPREWRALLLSDPGGTRGSTGKLAPLEMAREETAVLAALLPGSRRSELASPDAVQRLRAGTGLDEFDLIHVATHAHIDNARSEFSALYVTPADTGRAEAITAGEIAAGWRLNAQLVTLSGCATVTGQRAGIEGVLGLNQVVLAAGARALLASLWPVDDRATALLVGRFYENLIGTEGRPGPGMTAALAEARRHVREFRESDGTTPYRHPAYWSGLVLIGAPD